MTSPDYDQALLTRFLDGDEKAFDELMRRHEDRVFSVCLRTMGDREAALDATQETFITLFRKAAQYHGGAALGTWLYRIAINTCYDLHRRARRRAAEPLPEGHDPPDPTGADAFSAVELRPDLERALAAIPTDFRMAVVLSDLQGLPLQKVAEALGVPVGTVKSRIFRGRRMLAEQLGNPRYPPGHPTGQTHA
ncbi:MAG: RNA polymerase sigma factor [Acidimicrobiia bacterium]